MLEFKEILIYTGKDERVSEKTQKPYTIVNYLDDKGQTFGTIAECNIPIDLKQLQLVEVTFKVIPGRYLQLKTLSINKA